MKDKTNREPERERHVEDHDDLAESTDVKKETEIRSSMKMKMKLIT